MPTIEEITDKTDVDVQNELDYFAKAIYEELKDKFFPYVETCTKLIVPLC